MENSRNLRKIWIEKVGKMAGFALPLIGAAGSLLGGLFGSKQKQDTNGWQDTTNNVSTTGTSSTNPNLSPLQQLLASISARTAINNVQNPLDTSGYSANGLNNINQGADIQSKTLKNLMASRGLSFSNAGASPIANTESNRLNQSSQFLNSIPLLQKQFQQSSLSQLMQAFGMLPTGSSSAQTGTQAQTGETKQYGNVTTAGSPLAGAISGGTQGLFAALPFLSKAFGDSGGSGPAGGFYNGGGDGE